MRPPRHSVPGKGAVLASATVHGVLLLGAWWLSTTATEPIYYEVIQIELFSQPPSAAPAEEPDPTPAPQEELVVETPDPTPPAPEPDPIPTPTPEPVREPPPPTRTQPATPPPPTPPAERTPTASAEPVSDATTSGIDMNVRMEGLRRDFPEYYSNIILQIERCFRPSATGLSTRVQFEINRAGSVSGIAVVQPSGNIVYDIEAEGAIECAGRAGRFGPLPEELPFDRLPVQFIFDSQR